MECPNCKTQHDKLKKFCSVCGTPLGRTCQRCGGVNGSDDSYCGACGLPALDSESDNFHRGPARQDYPRQYDAAEIIALLSLRMVVEDENVAAQSYSQNDIDHLFE